MINGKYIWNPRGYTFLSRMTAASLQGLYGYVDCTWAMILIIYFWIFVIMLGFLTAKPSMNGFLKSVQGESRLAQRKIFFSLSRGQFLYVSTFGTYIQDILKIHPAWYNWWHFGKWSILFHAWLDCFTLLKRGAVEVWFSNGFFSVYIWYWIAKYSQSNIS